MEGDAWGAVFDAARLAQGDEARVYDQRSDNNVAILAAAIVYARDGDSVFKDKVVEAIEKLVGEGKWCRADVHRALEARDRRAAGPTAPAEGLYLVSVRY